MDTAPSFDAMVVHAAQRAQKNGEQHPKLQVVSQVNEGSDGSEYEQHLKQSSGVICFVCVLGRGFN